jgi:hypothetical protein
MSDATARRPLLGTSSGVWSFAGFIGAGEARPVNLLLYQGIAGKKVSGSAMLLEKGIVTMKCIGSEKRHLGLRCNPDDGAGNRDRYTGCVGADEPWPLAAIHPVCTPLLSVIIKGMPAANGFESGRTGGDV